MWQNREDQKCQNTKYIHQYIYQCDIKCKLNLKMVLKWMLTWRVCDLSGCLSVGLCTVWLALKERSKSVCRSEWHNCNSHQSLLCLNSVVLWSHWCTSVTAHFNVDLIRPSAFSDTGLVTRWCFWLVMWHPVSPAVQHWDSLSVNVIEIWRFILKTDQFQTLSGASWTDWHVL